MVEEEGFGVMDDSSFVTGVDGSHSNGSLTPSDLSREVLLAVNSASGPA